MIGGDNAGFPNGRRPGDDVVDIELRVVMGKLCTLNIGCVPADAPAGAIRFTDGAFLDETLVQRQLPVPEDAAARLAAEVMARRNHMNRRAP